MDHSAHGGEFTFHGRGLNFDTEGFGIVFSFWTVSNIGELVLAMSILFSVTLLGEFVRRGKGTDKFKIFENQWIGGIRVSFSAFITSLLMLAMMNFNGWIVLSIAFASGAAHLLVPRLNRACERQ